MSRTTRRVTAVIVIALCAIAVARTAETGFSSIDADDPHYLYTGRSVLDLQMPEQVDGSFPNLRSPLYGVVIAAGDAAVGGDEFVGAHAVAFALALAALAAAVVVGARLGGAPAALGVAIALLATPLVWRMLPTLRIDLVHAGAILAVVLAAWRPTTRRYLLAGIALGLTLLMKESMVLLALLPCAWIGVLPHRRVLRLAGAYLGTAVVTAGWWWVLVWIQVGEVFPAGNLAQVVTRDLARPFRWNTNAWLLVAVLAAGWVLFVARWHRWGDARLVMIAGAATALPALIAWRHELDMRQFSQLAVLSCVAMGVAVAGAVVSAWHARDACRVHVALGAAVAVAVGLATVSQVNTPARQGTVGVADALSGWMASRIEDRRGVVMTHRDHGELALRLYGNVRVNVVEFEPVDGPALDAFVWLGTNRGRLIGVSRSELAMRLRDPETGYLVLTGPHLLSLAGLEDALRTGTVEPAGITLATGITGHGFHAHVFEVDPTVVDPQLSDLPLTMTVNAARVWFEQRRAEVGRAVAVAELVAQRPTITGGSEALRILGIRLGHEAASVLGLPGVASPNRS